MVHIEMPKPNMSDDSDSEKQALEKLPYEVDYEKGSYSNAEAYRILSESDAEIIGEGFENIVVILPDHNDKVVAYSFFNPSENFNALRAKTIFYAHRILVTLFPHNFPKVHAAFAETDKKNKGSVRELIQKTKHDQEIKDSFAVVLHFFTECLHANPRRFFDVNPDNFMIAEDGGEYFVDLVKTFDDGEGSIREVFYENKENIIQYMKKNNYSEREIRKVAHSIDRLKVIENEQKKEE